MKIKEAKQFYANDKKVYELQNNPMFLKWLKSKIDAGYDCFISIEELQDLIDNIAKWYEIKYPERELEKLEGTTYLDFSDITDISNTMDFRQLLYRLPHHEQFLIECGYRAHGWCRLGEKSCIFMAINKKTPVEKYHHSRFLLHAEYKTGKVIKDYQLKEYYDEEPDMNLEEMLSYFIQKHSSDLEFNELKEAIDTHNCDIQLRQKILELVPFKLIYSDNTIPERGYERAKRFIAEFNKELGLNLSTSEIDKEISKVYTTDETEKGIKGLVKKAFNKKH